MTYRVLDLKYLAKLRPVALTPATASTPPPAYLPKEITRPRHVFAVSTKPQLCFDLSDNIIRDADIQVDERVMLVLYGDECTTTRVTETGEFIVAKVSLDGFSQFQPV